MATQTYSTTYPVWVIGSLKRRKPYKLLLDFDSHSLLWVALVEGPDNRSIEELKHRFPFTDCIKIDIHENPEPPSPRESSMRGTNVLNEANKFQNTAVSITFRTDVKNKHFTKTVIFASDDARTEFCDVIRASISSGQDAFRHFKMNTETADKEDFVPYLLRYANGSVNGEKPNRTLSDTERDLPLMLLPGEECICTSQFTSSIFLDNALSRGLFRLTNYRLVFRPYGTQPFPEDDDIPLAAIDKVNILHETMIAVWCKNGRIAQFVFDTPNKWVIELYKSIVQLTHHRDQTKLFAFVYGAAIAGRSVPNGLDGWTLYDPSQDYDRVGLTKNSRFRTMDNSDFKICKTYPTLLVFPACMSDSQILAVSRYRSGERLPAIIWKHPVTHATLSRCSQPKTGLGGKTCEEDVLMFKAIREASSGNSSQLYIIDARPYKAALGNAIKGKGYESMSDYKYCILEFQGIDNIHGIRGSVEKLRNLVNDFDEKFNMDPDINTFESSSWHARLDSSKWLHHVRIMLEAAVRVSRILDQEGASVVLHCSDGWDRTGQLTSLAQLMLDPFYRTLQGFAILIEKDWLSFGHKFADRYGHGETNRGNSQMAPIFLHFIDGVWQLLQQFPKSFEFNEKYLIAILDHAASCCYGTFLFNSVQERLQYELRQKTVSVWTDLLAPARVGQFQNRLYIPDGSGTVSRLYPNTSSAVLALWKSYHMRWIRPQKFEPRVQELGEMFHRERSTSAEHGANNEVPKRKQSDIRSDVRQLLRNSLQTQSMDFTALGISAQSSGASSTSSASSSSSSAASSAVNASASAGAVGGGRLAELVEQYRALRTVLSAQGVDLAQLDSSEHVSRGRVSTHDPADLMVHVGPSSGPSTPTPLLRAASARRWSLGHHQPL